MRFLFPVRACMERAIRRKKTIIALAVLCLISFILGIVFIKTPAAYEYYLKLCDRFIDRVCFSQVSVLLIFVERTVGFTLIVALLLVAGVHPAGLILPPALLVYRFYTFGGSVAIFLSVYRMTGVLIVTVLYLPVHLLIDIVCIAATSLSCSRACRFRFSKDDFCELGSDLVILFALIAAICLLEMLLLLVLFHPLGNIL